MLTRLILAVASAIIIAFTVNVKADSAFASSWNSSSAYMSGTAAYGGDLAGGVYSSSGTSIGHSITVDTGAPILGVAHDGYTGSGGTAGGFVYTDGYAWGSMSAASYSGSSGWVYLP
ncbi:MAG: hypothetical protein ACREBU_22595 [Nitrososphaera sp.]